MDAATLAVLDKGRKNVELLKQPQYKPLPVEEQVALIYCGTKGLLRDIPVEKVAEFEKEFVEHLKLAHKDVLAEIAKGVFNEEIEEKLRTVAGDICLRFANE